MCCANARALRAPDWEVACVGFIVLCACFVTNRFQQKIGGDIKNMQEGAMPRFGVQLHHPQVIANVLSLSKVKDIRSYGIRIETAS